MFDSDALLHRLERNALVFCAAATVVALIVSRGRWDVALGVLGGGLLVAVSYWAIRSSVTALVMKRGRDEFRDGLNEIHPDPVDAVDAMRPRAWRIFLGLVGRYALLGLMAYGMIARLRLSPVGLFIGISSLFLAACIEATRSAIAPRPPRA